MIDRDDLLRYGGHGLTYRIVDRIFQQAPRRFACQSPGKMGCAARELHAVHAHGRSVRSARSVTPALSMHVLHASHAARAGTRTLCTSS
jgi:hypothetical protein